MGRFDVSKAEVKKMGWQRKAWNYINGGKSLCSSSKEENAKPRTRPGLAVALALVFFVMAALLIVPLVKAADPGHPASAISGNTFDTGDFIFPTNLTVNKFFIANGSTLYVDAINGRIGIRTVSPDAALSFGSSSTIDTLTGNLTIQVPSGSRILVGTGDLGDAVGKRFGFGDSNPTAVFEIADGYNDNLDTFYVKSRANDANQKVAYLFGEATNFQGYLLYMDTNEESGSTWNYMKGLADADGTPVQQFLLTGEGKLILGSGNPTNKLTVVGDINATANMSTPTLCLSGSCQSSWPSGGAGWAASGNYVYNDTAAAKVGIGTATPQQKLDVIGTVNATDYICTGGSDCIDATEINSTSLASECSTITGSAGLCDSLDNTCSNSACTVGSDDTLTNPTVGGALSMANYPISNIGSTDTDFTSDGGLTLHGNFSVLGTGTQTIAGNTSFDGGTLFVDSNNDRVGIGTTSPNYLLEVANTSKALNVSNVLFVNGTSGNVGIGKTGPTHLLTVGTSASNMVLGSYTDVGRMWSGADSVFGHNVYADTSSRVLKQLVTGYYGAWIRMYYNGGIYFGTSTAAGTAGDTVSDPAGTTNEKMVITNAGNVGIGADPSKRLDVSDGTKAITFDPAASTPTISTTASSNLTITSSGGNVIIQLG